MIVRVPLRQSPCWVLILALAGCESTSSVDVAFQPRSPRPAMVAEVIERDKSAIGDWKPTGATQRVVAAFEQFNLATVYDQRQPAAIDKAMQNLNMALGRCLEDEGNEAIHKLVLWLLHEFDQRLQALIEASREVDGADQMLSGALPPRELAAAFRRFVEAGGDFVLHAANAGLLRPASGGGIELTDGARFFIRLAFKVRWAKLIPPIASPIRWLLSDSERTWYDIWVVERSKTASMERKIEAIERLRKRDKDYPFYKARGIVLYQAGRHQGAALSFKKALDRHPDDKRLKAFYQKAQAAR